MSRYLIHVGLQDAPGLLWEMELFYFAYQKYIDPAIYDLMFCVALAPGAASVSPRLEELAGKLPITITPDYSDAIPGVHIPENNKYWTVLEHTVAELAGRHLIIVDSDILLLPRFNELFRLEHNCQIAFELNEIHRARVPDFLRWYNAYYGRDLAEPDCLITPSVILHNAITERFLMEYTQLICDAPVCKSPDKPHKMKRGATMCGKSAIQIANNYSINLIPQFLPNDAVLESRADVFRYSNLHYYAKCPYFNKRVYDKSAPFGKGGKHYHGPGYHASQFIWETIREYEADGRY